MFINEAASIAASRTLGMRRETFPEGLQIIPTNDDACCIVLTARGAIAPRWNPTASDLTADDWIVIDNRHQRE